MSLANDHITTSTDSSAASADGKSNQQQQQQVKLIFNNTTNSSGSISSNNKNNVAIKRSASDYCDDVNNKKHKSDFKPTSSSVNINLKSLSSSTLATPTTNKNTNSDEEPQHQLNETYTLETTFNNSNNDDILSLPSSEITEEYVLFTTDVMEYMDVKDFSPQITTPTTSSSTPQSAVPPIIHNSSSVAGNNVITKDAMTLPPSTTTATLTANTNTSGVSGSGDIELLVLPNVPDLNKNTVTTVQFNKQTDKIIPSTSTNTSSAPSGLIRRHTVTSSSVNCNEPITSSASSLYSRCGGNLQTTIKNRPLIVSAKNRISEVTQTTAKVSIGNTTISVPLLKPLNSGHLMQQSTTVGGSCLTSTQPTSAAAQLNLSKILNVKRGHGQKILNQPTIVSLSQLQIKPVSNAKIVQAKVLNKKVPLQLKHFTNTTSGTSSSGVITISANKLATLQNNKLTTTIIQDTAATTTTTTATTSTTTAMVTAVNKDEYETIMADGAGGETDGTADTQLAEEPTACKTSNATMTAATVTTSLASTNTMKNLNIHTTLSSNGSTVLTKFATSETLQLTHNKIPMRTSTVSIISKQNTEHGVVYTCSSGTSTSGTSTLSNIPKKPQQQQLTNSTNNNSNNNNKLCLNPNAASVITIPRNISLMLAKSSANVITSQQSKLSTVAPTKTTTTTASEATSTATTSMAHTNVMAHIINSAPGKKLSNTAAAGHFNLAGLAAQRRLSQLCTETSYKQQQQQQTAILSCMAMKSSETINSTCANTLTSTTSTASTLETTSAATTPATSSSEAIRQLTSSKRSDMSTEEKDATSHKNNSNKRINSIGVNEETTSNMQPVMSKEITSSVSTITSSVSTTTPSMTAISTTNTNISVSTTKPEEAHNALLKQLLQNTTMVNVPSSSSAMSSVSTMYSSSISMSAATSSTHTLATVSAKTTNNSNQTFLPTTSTAAAAVSTTTTTMPVTTNNNAKGNFTPARKVINVRAPSLGMVSSLEAQLARPALPPVPAAAAQNLQSTSSIAATSASNSMSSMSTPKTMTVPTTASSFTSPSTDNNNYQQQQQITSTTTTANSTVDIMDISNNSERNKQQNTTNEQIIHHINNHGNNNSSGCTNNNNNSSNNQKNNSHKSNVQIILKETSFVSNPNIIQQQQTSRNIKGRRRRQSVDKEVDNRSTAAVNELTSH